MNNMNTEDQLFHSSNLHKWLFLNRILGCKTLKNVQIGKRPMSDGGDGQSESMPSKREADLLKGLRNQLLSG